MCVEEHNWGGCWRGTIGGKFYTSCKDDVRTYRSAASQTPELISGADSMVERCAFALQQHDSTATFYNW